MTIEIDRQSRDRIREPAAADDPEGLAAIVRPLSLASLRLAQLT